MTFSNDRKLGKYAIRPYSPSKGIESTNVAYRISTDFSGDNGTFTELFEQFINDDKAPEIKAVSIGFWGNEWSDVETCHDLPTRLIGAAHRELRGVKALFVGDISAEEAEVSWIEQFELGGVVNAFLELKHFKARGGIGLSLSCLNHEELETLIVETGGLSAHVVKAIAGATLPNLTHLELWTGHHNYGADVTLEDVMPLLAGSAYPEMRYPFPKLKYLGIRNSEIADAVAQAIPGSLVSKLITHLDLSKGLLSDEGIKALVDADDLGTITTLDVSSSYISDIELIERLKARGIDVINTGQRDSSRRWYVEVGE